MTTAKISQCDNCGSVAPCKVYPNPTFNQETRTFEDEPRPLCKICACTFLSRASQPGLVELELGQRYTMKAIATLTNALVDALGIRDEFDAALDKNSSWDGDA